jgi:Enoyl-(Acyl carrier protein) reductase
MRGRGWGRIALVSSGAGGEGWEGAAAYATAKAGLAGLARSLAWELGREGILVNVVAAGLTRTERVRSTGPPEVLEAIASRVPSRQLSEPLESGQALAGVADTLSEARTTGRLARVCQRWIYSSCLCFALDSSEQHVSGFTYTYSVYQAEYSRNLLFRSGATMERVFAAIIDRTRARIDVPVLKTLFGFKSRPHRDRKGVRPGSRP